MAGSLRRYLRWLRRRGADVIFNTRNEDGHFWDLSHDLDGWFGGARGGFDIQSGIWVFGVFGDIALANIAGSQTNPQDGSNFIGVDGPEDGPPVNFKTEIDKIATLQGRAGAVLGQRTLVYVHGGAAFADVTLSGSGGPANDFSSQSGWRAGVVGGVGVEHMLFNNVSVFAEYSYMNFLESDLFLIADGSDYKGAVNNQGRDLHTIIFGVNVRMPSGDIYSSDSQVPSGGPWQGLYGGIFAGYGAGDADVIFNTRNEDGHFWDLSHDLDGWFGGARGGFDIQSGIWVFGVFGDIALANIAGSQTNPQDGSNFIGVDGPEDGPPVNFKTEIDKIATLQGRAGAVLGQRTLVYVHGGAAFADVTLSGSGGPANDFSSQSGWRAGVVGGVGVEHMLFNNVSVFAEYSCMKFLESDLFLIADGSDYKGAVNNQGRNLHSVIFGVNVRLP